MDENTSQGGTKYELPKGTDKLLKRYGGAPYYLSYGNDDPSRIASEFNGLVLSGGFAQFPQEWFEKGDAPVHPPSARIDFEIALIKEFVQRQKPILAICHGYHMLVGIFGGKLKSDVPDAHYNTQHLISIKPDTKLYHCVKLSEIMVSSRHREAVKSVSDQIKISAYAKDGTIEAIEIKDYPFAVGIQWHGEDFADRPDHPSNLLFKSFIEHCRL